MAELLKGVTPYREKDVAQYLNNNWWRNLALGDLLDRAADMHPDQEAFVDRATRLTYGQARNQLDQLALGLMELGIEPLARVGMQAQRFALRRSTLARGYYEEISAGRSAITTARFTTAQKHAPSLPMIGLPIAYGETSGGRRDGGVRQSRTQQPQFD